MAQEKKETTFFGYCKLYESWKQGKYGVKGLNAQEVSSLRESYKKGEQIPAGATRLTEAKRKEIIARHRERIEAGKATTPRVRESAKPTASKSAVLLNKDAIRKQIREHFARKNGPALRESALAGKPKVAEAVTAAVAAKHIREARKSVYTAKRALREGDMALAAEGIADAGAAVNAVGAGVNLPPEITAAIQGIKAQVDDLATQAGIEPSVDLGANPNAGIPPVDGGAVPPAMNTPAAPMGGAPMLEGQKRSDEIAAIRERMAARRESLGKYREHVGAQNIGRNVVNSLCVDKFKDPEHALDGKVDTANPPTQIPEMPAKKLSAGTAKGVVRWPNKEVTPPADPTNVSKEYKHKAPKISESLDEQHVTHYIERDKLNFGDIYKNGLLG
jgi:hypothetical protein